MIKEGDKIPSVDITVVTTDGQETLSADRLFSGKKVVLFGVPGAFTPTCSASHLPGFVVMADQIRARGVDMIACVSINDVFVMRAWGEQQNAEAITLLADLGGVFTNAVGLGEPRPDLGGMRSQRYAMIIEDGVVTKFNVEIPKEFKVSDAETVLGALSQ